MALMSLYGFPRLCHLDFYPAHWDVLDSCLKGWSIRESQVFPFTVPPLSNWRPTKLSGSVQCAHQLGFPPSVYPWQAAPILLVVQAIHCMNLQKTGGGNHLWDANPAGEKTKIQRGKVTHPRTHNEFLASWVSSSWSFSCLILVSSCHIRQLITDNSY